MHTNKLDGKRLNNSFSIASCGWNPIHPMTTTMTAKMTGKMVRTKMMMTKTMMTMMMRRMMMMKVVSLALFYC